MKYTELTETLEELESYILAGGMDDDQEEEFMYILTELMDDQLVYLKKTIATWGERLEDKAELFLWNHISALIDHEISEQGVALQEVEKAESLTELRQMHSELCKSFLKNGEYPIQTFLDMSFAKDVSFLFRDKDNFIREMGAKEFIRCGHHLNEGFHSILSISNLPPMSESRKYSLGLDSLKLRKED